MSRFKFSRSDHPTNMHTKIYRQRMAEENTANNDGNCDKSSYLEAEEARLARERATIEAREKEYNETMA